MPESRGGLFEHPALIVGGMVLLGLIVYAISQQNAAAGSPVSVTYANTPQGTAIQDQNAATISQAAISAGASNIQTAAELIALEDTNRTSVINTQTTTAAQLEAERITAATQTAITESNNRIAAQNIAAANSAALAQTAAQRQATTDNAISNVISSIGADVAKVLSVISLGFL